jgi:hypothetical protein
MLRPQILMLEPAVLADRLKRKATQFRMQMMRDFA